MKLTIIAGTLGALFLSAHTKASDNICRFYDQRHHFVGQVQEHEGKLIILTKWEALSGEVQNRGLFADTTWTGFRAPSEGSTSLVIHQGLDEFCETIRLRVGKTTPDHEQTRSNISTLVHFMNGYLSIIKKQRPTDDGVLDWIIRNFPMKSVSESLGLDRFLKEIVKPIDAQVEYSKFGDFFTDFDVWLENADMSKYWDLQAILHTSIYVNPEGFLSSVQQGIEMATPTESALYYAKRFFQFQEERLINR